MPLMTNIFGDYQYHKDIITMSPWVDIRAFGARGNGIDDDTASIQSAVNFLTSGGAVFFPPGTYKRHTTEIDLRGKSNITFIGAGNASVILTISNTRVFDTRDCSNIIFKDFRVQGDFNTAVVDQTAQGLLNTNNTGVVKSSDILVDNIYFDNCAGDACYLGLGSTRVIVRNCRMIGGMGFVNLSGSVANGVTDIVIHGNIIKASLDSPRPGTAGITGSDDLIDIFGNTQNVSIVGNTFDQGGDLIQVTTAGHAIFMQGADPSNGIMRNISIIGNTMKNFYGNHVTYGDNHAAVGFSGGGAVTTDIGNLTVNGNTFYFCRNGIHSELIDLPIVFSNNSFEACRRGISDINAKNHTIKGNNFYGCTEFGIYNTNSYYFDIDGNFFLDLTTPGAEAIRCSIVYDHRIVNNYVQNGVAGSYGIRIPRGQRVLMMGNSIRNHPGTAILIEDNTSNDCMVYNNSYYNNGANLVDNGTGTHISDLPH